MKTIEMSRDFNYRAKHHVFVLYLGGLTYDRVPETAAREIIKAGAGMIVTREAEDAGP